MDITLSPFNKCKYEKYECSKNAERNQQFCIQHILSTQKPNTSKDYKYCDYASNLGNNCKNVRQVDGSTSYCYEHSRLNQINKMRGTIGRKKQLDSSEIIVSNLASIYLQNEKSKPQSTTKIDEYDSEEASSVDPFIEVNACEINNRGKKVLDYASDDDGSSDFSDTPFTTLSNTWYSEIDNSDDDSVDSDEADIDVLKHASTLQLEEIVKISKEKMQRLQSLYIDQFQRLQRVMREKRKNYLQGLKKEKEFYSNIYDQYKDSPKERKLYAKFKAMNHYHQRKYGVEAILHRKYLEKRHHIDQSLASNVALNQQKNVPKCIFSDGVKCLEKPLPHNKYCRKHILEDKKQILFKSCSIEKSGIVCQEPVVNIFEDAACVLHTSLYNIPRVYVKRKYESETDEDEIPLNSLKFELKKNAENNEEDVKIKVEQTDYPMETADSDDIKIN